MRKVFWYNPYQYTLITHVASVDGNQVLFTVTLKRDRPGKDIEIIEIKLVDDSAPHPE